MTDYNTASYGASVSFGFPISEIQRIGFNIAADHTELQSGSLASREILDFLESEGDIFDTLKLQAFWTRATLNRGIFPTDGTLNQVSVQTTVPGSSLNYFRLDYKNEFYQPINDELIFKVASRIGYVDSFGDSEVPPYFEYFYAGGPYLSLIHI